MSETLSKDEVDALLRGMEEGDVAIEGGQAPRGSARPYDLLAEDRLAGRRFPALDLVHEAFVRRLCASLTSLAGVTPTITLGALETVRFATFCNRLAAGACLQLFSLTPLRGQGLLAIPAALAFALIDRVFGGPGRLPDAIEGREYSALEQQTLKRIGTRMLADLAEAWTAIQRIECALVGLEANPARLAIAGPSDAIVVVELGCDIGGGPASLLLAIPYPSLEPLRDRLGAARATPTSVSDREWLATLSNAVRLAEVTVSAELGHHEISARELLRLRVGDVVALGTRGEDPVTLRVENVHVMTGLAGVSRGHNAIRLLGAARGE
jgi:flagellar motor switch protein FliM